MNHTGSTEKGEGPLRILFFGTAELACPSLTALAKRADLQVVAVVTQPDRPKGRELNLSPPPVKVAAERMGLPVLQPARARHPEFIQTVATLAPALIVVAAYGQILPQAILDLPRYGCLNVHTSLLPKYRGAAPIQWAIWNGDSETGVTIMKMDAGLDTGDILTQERTQIEPGDNSHTLHDRLAKMGAELLVRTIPEFVTGRIAGQKQPESGTSYARKISKEDGLLDWKLPARHLWNRVRALTPWPGAYTYWTRTGTTERSLLKILEVWPVDEEAGAPGEVLRADKDGVVVGCGEGSLRITKLQREGGRRLAVQEFLNGIKITPGERFEVPASTELE